MLVFLFSVISLAAFGFAFPPQEIRKRQQAQVITQCTVPRTVALTFDDGPYEYLHDIVDLLDANDAKATFFFNGNSWTCIYSEVSVKRVEYAYSNGHQVASHTWSHKNLPTLDRTQMTDEMTRIDVAIEEITGAVPAFMRPPYRAYNNLVLQVAGSMGQLVALWDYDTQDSLGASPASQKRAIDALIANNHSAILPIEHETLESTVHDVLPYFIQKLKAAEYNLVTMAECTEKNPYLNVGSPSGRNSSWHC